MLDAQLDQQLGTAPAPLVHITVRRSRLGAVRPADLLTIARRDNPKRAVLFVSRVLGKHLPVDPAIALLAGAALGEAVEGVLRASASASSGAQAQAAEGDGASPVADALSLHLLGSQAHDGDLASIPNGDPTSRRTAKRNDAVVIGYAETATALGHAVRRELGVGPTAHTTRVVLDREPLITFSEPHSHAVEHLLYHRDDAFLDGDRPVVLVDDELTTGQTALNTIAAIQARWPRRHYVVASLVDWRSAAARAAFEAAGQRLGARIDAVSLLAGEVAVHEAPDLAPWLEAHHRLTAAQAGPAGDDGRGGHGNGVDVIGLELGPPTSRLGWTLDEQRDVPAAAHEAGQHLLDRRNGPSALVLGTEELMFTPMVLADGMGPGVHFRSTTRSPIVAATAPGYPIVNRAMFANPADPGPDGGHRFLYNNGVQRYDDVFVCFEGEAPSPDHPLFDAVARCARHVHAVVLR